MNCNQCGACCIAPSISSIIPKTGKNKPAGQRCVHLSNEMKCLIYADRPTVCRDFTPTEELCGNSFSEAFTNLENLEKLTAK
ncbi:MAG: YkgJ family cysteine cluster protein [Leptospirales bacterium]|nr:YkgJ family cysteine cluster protein [Leptospirales bacterium]